MTAVSLLLGSPHRRVARQHPIRPWLAALLAGLLLAGCAESRYVMRFGLEGTPQENLPRWPLPPDVPRFFYAGELLGDPNYQAVEPVDASALEKAVKWLVGLATIDPSPRRLQRPQAILVEAGGRILVTDVGLGAVFAFDQAGGRLEVWRDVDFGQVFVSPIGIAAGRNGEILVADAGLGVVVRLDPSGRPLGQFGGDVLTRPTGIARDAARGQVFVSDTQAHRIQVFDDDGNLVNSLGSRGARPGQFNYPTFLAFAAGRLYVTDTMNARIQLLDPDSGEPLRVFGERGRIVGDLVRPKGLAVDDEGHIYVVESLHDHLLVFDPHGQLLLPIGGQGFAPGNFYLPSGVTVDDRNRVFVADTFNGRVSIFQFLGS